MPRKPTALLHGTLDLIVLDLLREEPTNGFELARRIQTVSRGVLEVNAGSLYPALYRLEARGLIRSRWENTANNRTAKVYSVTAKGRKAITDERAVWDRFAGALSAILDHRRA